jgi:hypothetical protein
MKMLAVVRGGVQQLAGRRAGRRMLFSHALFFLLQQAIHFFHERMKLFGVLLNGSLRTKFHPTFFLLALHSFSLQAFKSVQNDGILVWDGDLFQVITDAGSGAV